MSSTPGLIRYYGRRQKTIVLMSINSSNHAVTTNGSIELYKSWNKPEEAKKRQTKLPQAEAVTE